VLVVNRSSSLRVGVPSTSWTIFQAVAATWALMSAAVATAADQTASLGPRAAPVLEINGAIGPATSRYVTRGLEAAQASGAPLVILQLDTPGGLDSSMRDIIRAILASSIPVVSYVAPSGARAASAGTYILYASHIAAMAPATNLGAATPVSIGGEPAPAPERERSRPPDSGTKPADSGAKSPKGKDGDQDAAQETTAMERKVVNDAVAYIRSLAELRGRNAEWAESAVRGAASLSSTAALQQKVVEVIARDVPDLLTQINGREVRVGQRTVKLATQGLTVVEQKPDWRTEFLAVITNPTIAYGLMLIGIYGLLLEGYNPGAVLPGVVGVICLLLALFAFQILSVNYAGLALVVVGIGLIVAEFFLPAFGSLGLGGLIAFVVGSLILFDTDVPGMNIGLPLIAGLATVGGLVVVGIAWLAARSRGHPVVTGMQAMLGDKAEVVAAFEGRGVVRYGGELWRARSSLPLQSGQTVRIARVEGLTVWVEPLPATGPAGN
jgi:membrane-bound serine protease (ClpP class)